MLGIAMFLVGPFVWYISLWSGSGLSNRIEGATPGERRAFDTAVFMCLLFAVWIFVVWRIDIRRSNNRPVDGGFALAVLGVLEMVAMIGALVLTL
ncbi:hypothetical protein [Promicromonospora sp. NPDC057488]|uniref:hypothetical protein n=1 Tax=Promicromonospora sp. NPDC057488 TaxID=3346147 RepID=UPI00366FCCEC